MLKRAFPLALALVAWGAAFAAAANAPSETTSREFVLADVPQEMSLDPLHTYTAFESQFYTAIYEGLVVADPLNLQPVPGVASKWDSSNGGLTWRFTLRGDAQYSNGDRVRAQDFVASWLRMLDPANNAENSYLFDVIKGARAYRTGAQKDPSKVGIKAVSDNVLQVDLEGPASHFLKMLTHIAFLPVHPSLVGKTGWGSDATVIGNGPFVLKSRTDTELVLEKNPHYWDADNVGVDRLRVLFTDDAAKATTDFLSGGIQWIAASSLINFSAIPAGDNLEVYPQFATTYFYFDCGQAPWSDWRVRRGLALLVPWDTVRSKDAFYFPSEQLVPTIPSYPFAKGIPAQQVAEGKKLLADAGFPDGRGLPSLVVKLQKDSGLANEVKLMADAWKTLIGLTVAVKEVDPASYLTEVRKYDYTMGVATWIGDYADPLTFLQMWTTGSNLNDARFSDKDYDAAITDSLSMVDNTARYQRLSDAESILLTKAAILPLDHYPAINLINTNSIGGWFSNPLDVHPFKFITFKARMTPPGIAMGNLLKQGEKLGVRFAAAVMGR